MTTAKADAQVRAKNAQVRVEEAKKRAGCASKGVKNAQVRANDAQLRAAKVINTSRARGMTYADGDNNFYEPLTDHACGRARARKRLPFSRAEVALWRELIFADGIEDPVKVAVKDAVRDFGSRKDFTIWAWYANRIGINNFLELYFEQQSVMRRSILRNPAAAFHARLKRFYAAYAPKEGQPSVALAEEGGRHV